MSKWNVKIDLWEYVDNIEAENEQEAIKKALYELLDEPNDYFTDTNKLVDKLLYFSMNNSCYAEEDEND